MQDVDSILGNQILLVAIIACLLAQGIKLITSLIQKGRIDVRHLFSTGGMPSAHSALVAALATGVGQVKGWNSAEFAIAALFAVIVMYDAAGVRQAAGKQARILNQILDELFQEGKELNEERLKELLGHTPFQVLMGLILGIGVSLVAGMIVV
ncbi:MAG: divergent PAP2 family protein [Spirulina sp. DLM2.Bin59]|nr:MAG: divergent PAP2 family protein [Spirulina sp. DLM2.Bin59]